MKKRRLVSKKGHRGVRERGFRGHSLVILVQKGYILADTNNCIVENNSTLHHFFFLGKNMGFLQGNSSSATSSQTHLAKRALEGARAAMQIFCEKRPFYDLLLLLLLISKSKVAMTKKNLLPDMKTTHHSPNTGRTFKMQP